TKTLPTCGHPHQVAEWVKTARKGTPKVPLDTFPAEWWKWWTGINPQWRLVDGELRREGEGSWDALRTPGLNGLLNVVVCLKWWRVALKESESADWLRAVEDVTWVLQKMVG
ncbi:hypothetical protein C8R45DRAFT_832683, partial [Mycena sanguinolenta]